MKVVAVFALLVAMTTAVDLTMKDCGSSAEVTRAFSDDCKDAVCKLKKGSTYQINISFKPKSTVSGLKASLAGVIAGIPIPFPLPESDGCVACGNTCPITAGTEVTFSEALKVENSYPALRLVSRWKLDTADGHVLCVEIPVVIVS
ncbi:hypothetical protein ACHWQZ_G000637 [Mnemiopsis leidyi]